jgi:signal transduction histidine kinase
MTGNFFLDWPSMAISLINVILLFWLGLTVLLNAERRTWGVWLTGGGMLLGTAFFVSHSAILGYGLSFDYWNTVLNIWWQLGWIPLIASPFIWYALMLWYAGFWDDQGAFSLPQRQSHWLLITFLMLVGLIGWFALATPLPSFTQLTQFELSATPAIGGMPVFLLIYPLYIILCIGLALNVLRHPAASERIMGDQARQRAHPWLVGVSATLLLVSFLVAGIIAWVLLQAQRGTLAEHPTRMSVTVAWFNLIISSLIAISVVLLGQAIVSYEVFTGKTLPRRELRRQWWNAVVLAVGYGFVVGLSLALQFRPIYSLLLTTVLMVLFYALLSWRSYTWRERYIRHLRPFVASQRLYEHLLAPASPVATSLEVDIETPFQALCEKVIGAQLAYLIPLGSLAPLGKELAYPDGGKVPPVSQLDISHLFRSPQTMCMALDPTQHGGALWAIPLWSERGLIGVLFLGSKQDNGLYTQEEIEIARATGERLIDTQASAEIAHRLMNLQRQRLAESQILDRQTRRVLHDEVLPHLHTALLMLNGEPAGLNGTHMSVANTLTNVHHQISDLLREMPKATLPALNRPGLMGALQRVVSDELPGVFDEVTWQVTPEAEKTLQTLPPLTKELLFYAAREAIRNAGHHGRAGNPQRPLHLRIAIATPDDLTISIEDDGVGIETAKSTTGGSGQGLALHSTMLAIIGGTLDIQSVPERYTCITLRLPQAAIEALEF